MLRLITDFDGPIMDVSDRYYHVYTRCLATYQQPDQFIKQLSKAEFWRLKRAQVPEWQIGRLSGLTPEQARAFAGMRARIVHDMPYLVHDRLIPGAVATLEACQRAGIDLVVMTMRRQRELAEPLKRHRLDRFFAPTHRYCIEDDYVKTDDVHDKPRLMARALAELPPVTETWMVGDTEADIAAAQAYGIQIIAVLSGIRDRTQLAQHNPDYIVNNLQAAVELIQQTRDRSYLPSAPVQTTAPSLYPKRWSSLTQQRAY
ncbi:HAD family hydrolase [Trichothermofontia sp.]